jgi:hypothetical protein
MRRLTWAALLLGAVLAGACAAPHHESPTAPGPRPAVDDDSRHDRERCRTKLVYRPSAALLFDANPGEIPPDAFAFRSDWPAVERPYDSDDVIYYIEAVRDYEGQGGLWWNQTRRYYRSYRAGVAPR